MFGEVAGVSLAAPCVLRLRRRSGAAWERTVFARVYLTEFARDYAAMNAIWEASFPPGGLPGRTCVGVTGLAVGALVEIDLVVAL